jgi:diguanylate cyclase (GGDEF)-like protein
MTDLSAIIERLKQNEDISRKFHEIETRILTILDFTDLFEILLTQIREKFKVPYAWLSMIEKSEVSTLIHSLESSEMLKERLNIIDRDSFFNLAGSKMKPLLANTDLKPYYRLLPKDYKYFIKSIAIAPISLDGEIIGSLNQADFSPRRFQPGIDTSCLEQLAVKVSLCLSNVTAHEKIRFMAYHDPLTKLLNRRVMESILKREMNRSRRYGSTLSVVFVDLDDFKKVNDRYGHDHGDALLQYVAEKLLDMSRDADVVARFAGDEFVLILPETPAESAEILMKRVEAYLTAHPLEAGGHCIPAAISFGVASTEDSHANTPSRILKGADKMLYRVKAEKKANTMNPQTTVLYPEIQKRP